MMKYMGTSVSSKNRKNTSKSSERKLPRQPASSRSSHATKDLSPDLPGDPASAIGNSTADMSTRNSEMPSMPSDHEMPSEEIQGWTETIWKFPSLPWNATAVATEKPSVASVPAHATARTARRERPGSSAATSAAPAGSRTSTLR